MTALSDLRPPFEGLAFVSEENVVLIHIRINIVHHYQKVLNITISIDPDETPRHFLRRLI